MGKKILSIALIAAMLFSLCACGEGSDTGLAEPIFTDEKILLDEAAEMPVNNSSGVPLASEYVKILDASGDYKYILFAENEDETASVYAVPREDLYDVIESTALDDYIKEIGDNSTFLKENGILDLIENHALTTISNLTIQEGLLLNTPDIGEVTYLTYNQYEWENSAFGDIYSAGTTVTEYMQSEDLRLLCDSPVVKKVIYNEEIGKIGWSAAVVVEAEVFCSKNDGAFKKISWIPKEGRSKTLDFILTFWTYTDTTGEHVAAIGDIYVIGQSQGTGLINKISNFFE